MRPRNLENFWLIPFSRRYPGMSPEILKAGICVLIVIYKRPRKTSTRSIFFPSCVGGNRFIVGL